MKTWKLVSGILCIVLCLFVMLQSCAAGFVNTVENNGDVSGSAGLLVSIFMLVGGIVSIATRSSQKKGGNIALVIIFGIAGLLGISNVGIFGDLIIWSGWCLLLALIALIAVFKKKKTID